VDRTENQCGGQELIRYYRDDRILYYDRDTFYVRIKDDPGNTVRTPARSARRR